MLQKGNDSYMLVCWLTLPWIWGHERLSPNMNQRFSFPARELALTPRSGSGAGGNERTAQLRLNWECTLSEINAAPPSSSSVTGPHFRRMLQLLFQRFRPPLAGLQRFQDPQPSLFPSPLPSCMTNKDKAAPGIEPESTCKAKFIDGDPATFSLHDFLHSKWPHADLSSASAVLLLFSNVITIMTAHHRKLTFCRDKNDGP